MERYCRIAHLPVSVSAGVSVCLDSGSHAEDLPAANLKASVAIQSETPVVGDSLSFQFTNGDKYARLVRVRVEWAEPAKDTPVLVLYDDNYFDLLPGENRVINAKLLYPLGNQRQLSGKLIVTGTNVEPMAIPIGPTQATAQSLHQ